MPPVVGEKEVTVNDFDIVFGRKHLEREAARAGGSIDYKRPGAMV